MFYSTLGELRTRHPQRTRVLPSDRPSPSHPQGYPDRIPIREFVNIYRCAVPAALLLLPNGASASEREACAALLRGLDVPEASVQLVESGATPTILLDY